MNDITLPQTTFRFLTRGRQSSIYAIALALACIEAFLIVNFPLAALVIPALFFAAIARSLPIAALFGVALTLRAVLDQQGIAGGRSSVSLDIASLIAVLLVLSAASWLLLSPRLNTYGAIGLLALLLWTFVALYTLGVQPIAIREPFRELSIIASGYIAYRAHPRISLRNLIRTIQIAAAIPITVALFQAITGSGMLVNGVLRSNGTFVHPNGAAVFFALVASISLWNVLHRGNQKVDILFLLSSIAATVTTGSLGGLTTLTAMLLTIAAGSNNPTRRINLTRRLALLFLIVGVVVAFSQTSLGASRIASLTSETSIHANSGESKNSFTWRTKHWASLLEQWTESPILGRGLGYTVVVASRSPTLTVPHNEYLRYLIETGLLGVTIITLLVGVLLRGLVDLRQFDYAVAALGLALIVGLLINGLGANTFLYTAPAYCAAALLGSIFAAQKQHRMLSDA